MSIFKQRELTKYDSHNWPTALVALTPSTIYRYTNIRLQNINLINFLIRPFYYQEFLCSSYHNFILYSLQSTAYSHLKWSSSLQLSHFPIYSNISPPHHQIALPAFIIYPSTIYVKNLSMHRKKHMHIH